MNTHAAQGVFRWMATLVPGLIMGGLAIASQPAPPSEQVEVTVKGDCFSAGERVERTLRNTSMRRLAFPTWGDRPPYRLHGHSFELLRADGSLWNVVLDEFPAPTHRVMLSSGQGAGFVAEVSLPPQEENGHFRLVIRDMSLERDVTSAPPMCVTRSDGAARTRHPDLALRPLTGR